MITCVRLPFFGPTLEQRDHPALAGPLALVDGERITEVSPEAAQAGVRPGMSPTQAQAVCDGLHVLPAAPARYRRAFEDLLAALTHFTDRVEPETGLELRADARRRRDVAYLPPMQLEDHPAATCYLDLGSVPDSEVDGLAREVHTFVQGQLGFPAAVGLASGKFPARVAALLLKPGETLVVPTGQEAAFLAELTVMLLPVDGETMRQLHLLGLHTLGDVAALPLAAVIDRFGRQGRVMHRLASGRDTSPVQPYTPPVLVRGNRQFETPVNDWAVLHATLAALVERLHTQLNAAGQVARQIVVAVQVDGGGYLERTVTLRQPRARLEAAVETVCELASSLPVTEGVTGVEVTLDDIGTPDARQLSLFEREPVSTAQLRAVLQTLVKRYGDECFYLVHVVDEADRLPERRVRLEKVSGR